MDYRRSNTAFTDSVFMLSFVTLLLLYAWTLVQFVSHDSLSSIATDSANYMVMARYLSPWHDTSAAIMHAWPNQDYPVFFPLILALSGSAYDFFMAHALTAVFFVLALPCIYLLARQHGLNRFHASLLTTIVAISPATWINSLGILSENLYLLISVVTLLYYQHIDRKRVGSLVLLGILIGLMVITRTVGISMLAAYATVCGIDCIKQRKLQLLTVIPVVVAIGIIVIARILHDASLPAQYIDQFTSVLSTTEIDAYRNYNLLEQIVAITDAWFSGWLYYWNSNLLVPYLVYAVVGVLALIGIIQRGLGLRLDAYYLLIYLLIILAWPHPGQALRFIYPVLFLLVLNASHAVTHINWGGIGSRQQQLHGLLLILALASIIPAQFYTWNRHSEGEKYGYQYYKEFYQLHDRNEALENAEIQTVIYQDLKKLENTTQQGDRIMYFIPAYIALLTDRTGIDIKFTSGAENQVLLDRSVSADYVYLTSLHPRKTGRETNGLYIYAYFRDWTDLLKVSYTEKNRQAVSYLLRVK